MPLGAKTIGRIGAAVLGGATRHPFAPGPKGRSLEFRTHQGDHGFFLQAELISDGLEASAVFPGHLDHPIDLLVGERLHGSVLRNFVERYGQIALAEGRTGANDWAALSYWAIDGSAISCRTIRGGCD